MREIINFSTYDLFSAKPISLAMAKILLCGEELISVFIISPQTQFGGYTGVSLSIRLSVLLSQNLVWGITSKVLKLVTSNFVHR